MLSVRDSLTQESPDMIVVKRIDHLLAVALTNDQTQVTQHPQLVRNGGLAHPDLVRQLPDRARAYT